MIGIVVCTHGAAGRGLVQSAEMICGKQDNVSIVSYEMGDTIEDLRNLIICDLKELNQVDGILILTDIKGGTPFNVIVGIIRDAPQYRLLTGVNVPMLLEVFINRSNITLPTLTEKAVVAANNGIYQYISVNENMAEDEEF